MPDIIYLCPAEYIMPIGGIVLWCNYLPNHDGNHYDPGNKLEWADPGPADDDEPDS